MPAHVYGFLLVGRCGSGAHAAVQPCSSSAALQYALASRGLPTARPSLTRSPAAHDAARGPPLLDGLGEDGHVALASLKQLQRTSRATQGPRGSAGGRGGQRWGQGSRQGGAGRGGVGHRPSGAAGRGTGDTVAASGGGGGGGGTGALSLAPPRLAPPMHSRPAVHVRQEPSPSPSPSQHEGKGAACLDVCLAVCLAGWLPHAYLEHVVHGRVGRQARQLAQLELAHAHVVRGVDLRKHRGWVGGGRCQRRGGGGGA